MIKIKKNYIRKEFKKLKSKIKIKYINNYIQDYVKITEDYKKAKKQQANK